MARKQVALAKISRPRLHDVLARTRLYGALDQACARSVAWLCAQPGAGKTTLVASFLQARKRTGVWYQVDAADADAASFIYHLRLAASHAGDARSAELLPLLTPEYLPDLAGFSRRFFRELFASLGAEAVLVLDNFQEVPEDSAFHVVIAEGMAQVPPGVAVIVISRVEPPSTYAPLLAAGAIDLLDGTQLRLTLAETRAIARKRGVVDDAAVEALQARSNGWAAGLTLLLTRTRGSDGAREDDDVESLQHVFGYFAQRVFDGAAAEHRQALMQLAFLPLMTVELAERLTALPEAGRLLERYYKRHLFTDRRRVTASAGQPGIVVYQFHALFRTYLQHQARLTLGDEAARAIASRAAELLDAAGHWEHALALHAEARDWAAYGRIMAARIEGLLEQGRRQTVVDWLARMPEAARRADPWLAYWEGRALMATAPEQAVQLFDAGLERFAAVGDAAGQLACGAAAVQTLWYARLGWSEITPRVDNIERLLDAPAAFPSRATELLSYSALHAALAFCRPAHAAVPGLGVKLLGYIGEAGIDWNQRLSTATHLVVYFHNAAEHDLAMRLNALVDPAVETLPASALNRAFWYVFRAIHDLRQVDYAQAVARFRRAEALAHDEGLAHAEFAALQFCAYLEITFRHAAEAQALLARLERHPARNNPDGALNYCVAQTMYAQLRGDVPAAHAHAENGLVAVERIGAAYFRAVFPALFASALADAGQTERARRILSTSRELSRGSYLEAMESQLCLEEAYVALVSNEQDAALERLAQGLAAAAADRRRVAYIHRIVTRKPVLLATALAHGIEVDLAREMVRRWRLPPPAEEVPNWPWPIRVYTLGGFEVRVDDVPIEFGRKAPKKTLALLKAIIARGGSATEAVLIDNFWRNEDGDAASRSLGAAVHRLRGLIGDAEAVQQQGGVLSLDRLRVWVDAWAFERHADAIETLALYRGTFLVEEEGEAWSVAMRERLRSRFIQSVSTHAARLEAARRDEEAIALYLRGIAADDVVEPFYQGLMRCYHRLDRLPEAVSAYRRLKQTLSVTLSLAPSVGTEKLYRALRLG